MVQWLYGKPVSEAVCAPLPSRIAALRGRGVHPCLAIVRIGDSADDISYERGAMKKCQSIGIKTEAHTLGIDISRQELIARLSALNADSNVHGILLLRPFPAHIDELEVRNTISRYKDVDGFSPENTAKLYEGDNSGFPPCTPTAVVDMLKYYHVPLAGSRVVVLGRSLTVGMPVSMLLLRENATVTICHSKTQNMREITAGADILISAVGKTGLINGDCVKEGATIIDIGINSDAEGNICGDADVDSVIAKVKGLTPVPGGVGSVTTSILARHVVQACEMVSSL